MVNRDTKYRFPIYQSSEDALKEGIPVSVYDPNKARKHWFDPNPVLNADGEAEYKVFKYTGNMVQVDPVTGLPKFVTLRLSPEWAKTLNIYDPQFHNQMVPDLEVGSIPAPIRDLKEGETWKFGFLSEPTIVVNKPTITTEAPSTVSKQLEVIEEKLNRIIVILGSK